VYRDPERYRQQYWSQIPGAYFTGDGARRDADGYFWVMGRIDDVVNVAGHRLGTMEVESALVSHTAVAEAAVVGRPDELKGQAIAAFITLEAGRQPSEELRAALKQHVAKEIGAFARPDDIRFTDALPKTRSGKIMRRLLRDIAAGKETLGDTTTLEDYAVPARRRAAEVGIPAAELAEREIRAFGEDVAWLRCLPPTHEPRATEHIPTMLALIERLIGAGFAYPVAGGSVYFRVRRFAAYGKLSHR